MRHPRRARHDSARRSAAIRVPANTPMKSSGTPMNPICEASAEITPPPPEQRKSRSSHEARPRTHVCRSRASSVTGQYRPYLAPFVRGLDDEQVCDPGRDRTWGSGPRGRSPTGTHTGRCGHCPGHGSGSTDTVLGAAQTDHAEYGDQRAEEEDLHSDECDRREARRRRVHRSRQCQ